MLIDTNFNNVKGSKYEQPLQDAVEQRKIIIQYKNLYKGKEGKHLEANAES